ncbi:MAG TPA: cysteine dioxygenase family protein [Paraburkholderia sp.]|nr:cysteine dioxygenase family protein [Paraburkholderia sp.]
MSREVNPLAFERHPAAALLSGTSAQPLTRPAQTTCCSPADSIARLCAALDAACAASSGSADPSCEARFARSVRIALAEAAADPQLLTPAQRASAPQKYQRHLLAADPRGRYAIASLVWQPGQASPVHAHHTWCGYAVLEGTLSEAIYDWNEAQDCAIQDRTQPRTAGAVSFTRAGRDCIHQLGNASDALAISLHVYGVPEAQFATHVNDIVHCADSGASVLVARTTNPA